MSPPSLPRRLPPSPCPGIFFSKRRLVFVPATTPSPSSKRHRRGGVATEQLLEAIGGEAGGDDAGGSCHRGMPSKRRLDSTPTTRSKSNRSRTRAGAEAECPVEAIVRIRNLAADGGASALEVVGGGTAVRVRHGEEGGSSCRDFTLDGVSVSDEEGLEGFYRQFVRPRVVGVCSGAKCTVIVYGPTGSGKSHTMFGSAEQPGVVYRALRDILEGEHGGGGEDDAGESVRVSVVEIYNENVYDLLAGSGGTNTTGNALKHKVKLEVVGTPARNATYIPGNEAGEISRKVAEVEKRRAVKSTLCNERSSRSHCMIILDVPSVGGRLMLVDMAGSENIEAAGQTGFEAKMQDSFEDDNSKILMILCASPDQKELHKTISTLEYGAKAKCIVRAAHASTPRDKMNSEESSLMPNSRIVAMNQFMYKLQKENKQREKERNEAQTVLRLKEDELAQVKAKLRLIEGQDAVAKEEEVNLKVIEKTKILKSELQMMEEKMLRQQQELLALKQRLQEAESEKMDARQPVQQDIIGGILLPRLSEMYAGGDQSTVLDMKVIKEDTRQQGHIWNKTLIPGSRASALEQEDVVMLSGFSEKGSPDQCL